MLISRTCLGITLLLSFSVQAATVVMGLPSPVDSLNPFTLTGIESFATTGYAIEAMARSNPQTGAIEPKLAKSWTLNPKSKTFQVKLRDKVEFHDGSKFTADDVKFTYDSYFDPKYGGAVWQGMWDGVESAKVIDPLTVEFKLKKWRYETFEAVMTSMRILPKSFYAPADAQKFRAKITGTGPFKLKSFAPGGNIEFEPNDKWWGQRQDNFNLIVKRVPDAKLAGEMMAKGQLDYYQPRAEHARSLTVRDFELKKLQTALGTGIWLELNSNDPLFKSPKLREALLKLWRREDLNRQVYKNELQLALDPFSPNTDFYPNVEPVKFDLAEARKLLSKDGWADSDKDSVLDKTTNGKKQNLEFSVVVTTGDHERWVTLYQADAAQAGVKVQIERAEEGAQMYKRLSDGKYQAVAQGGGLMNEATRLAWHSQGPYNFGKYNNKQVDAEIERLETEFDLKKRRLILRKIIETIRRDLPVVPGLYSPDQYFMTSPRILIDAKKPADPSQWKVL